MRIGLSSVFVDDQDKALAFYTEKLGFVLKDDMPMGDDFRWLTVVSPDDLDGTQLVLEPDANPVAKTYHEGLYEHNIPINSFAVDDLQSEYKRLVEAGVVFASEPVDMGGIMVGTLDDTCGNWIQIYQA